MSERTTWIDMRTADLLVGDQAVAQRLPESLPGDVVPLAEAVRSAEPPHERHDKLYVNDWTRDDYMAFGHWALSVLKESEAEPQLLRDDLERFYQLGHGPHYVRMARRFGSIWQYREALGIHPQKTKGRFDSWSQTDFIDHARSVAANKPKDTRPTETDYQRHYDEGSGPPIHIIFSRMGSIGKLNELIGFPNIHDWDYDDYIEWGVKIVRANNGLIPTTRMMIALSKRKRGPTSASVAANIGSVEKFQYCVAEEYTRQNHENEQREAVLTKLWQGELQPLLEEPETEQTAEQKHALAAHYEIASLSLGSAITPKELVTIANLRADKFMASIRRHRPAVGKAELETIAMTHGLLDYLDPPDTSWMSYLKVTEKDLPFRRSYNKQQRLRAVDLVLA
jgi:hypothetical protein